MKARRKKVTRKCGTGMSFGELVRKLWQLESDVIEPTVVTATQRQSTARAKRVGTVNAQTATR